MEGQVVLLHLSDIHFAKSKLGEPYDLDEGLRSRLQTDAAAVADDLGPPNAILISGDIAFSGSVDQYRSAKEWLDEGLCAAINGDPAAVWTVPGNHDVDQKAIESKPTYVDARKKFRDCQPEDIERLLHYHLSEPEVFFSPIKEYNRFAFERGCEISVKKPVWSTKNDFALNDGTILRIYGLNSSLISDENDDFESGRMVLGEFQCQLPVDEENVENIAVCHHPPDWLRDGDKVEEILNPRSCVQLFGHKHKHRLRQLDESLLVVSAGAVHPSRKESGWEPRYNWLVIWIAIENDQRVLKVKVYPRVWNTHDQAFKADLNNCDEGVPFKCFSLKPRSSAPRTDSTKPPGEAAAVMESEVVAADREEKKVGPRDSRGNPIMNANRTLAQRYFQLGYVKKMKIATELNLLRNGDENLPDHERQRQHLRRAREPNVLPDLWNRVEQKHGDGRYPENPFVEE